MLADRPVAALMWIKLRVCRPPRQIAIDRRLFAMERGLKIIP
jgi:hypothetical protein